MTQKNRQITKINDSIIVVIISTYSTRVSILLHGIGFSDLGLNFGFGNGFGLFDGFLRKVATYFDGEGLLILVETLVFSEADLFSGFYFLEVFTQVPAIIEAHGPLVLIFEGELGVRGLFVGWFAHWNWMVELKFIIIGVSNDNWTLVDKNAA